MMHYSSGRDGFNFTESQSFYMAVQGEDGSYGGRVLSGHLFNCYPFDVVGAFGTNRH